MNPQQWRSVDGWCLHKQQGVWFYLINYQTTFHHWHFSFHLLCNDYRLKTPSLQSSINTNQVKLKSLSGSEMLISGTVICWHSKSWGVHERMPTRHLIIREEPVSLCTRNRDTISKIRTGWTETSKCELTEMSWCFLPGVISITVSCLCGGKRTLGGWVVCRAEGKKEIKKEKIITITLIRLYDLIIKNK